MKNRPALFFIGVVVVLVCFFGGMFGGIYWLVSMATEPATTAADTFMTALKEEEYREAYGLLSLRRQDGTSPQDLQQQSRLQGSPIDTWRWSSVSVAGNEADLKGEVTFEQEQRRALQVSLVWVDDRWLIDTFAWHSGERNGQ